MLAKNQINRNKMENITKYDNENKDFMPFIQNTIKEHVEIGNNSNKYVFINKQLKIGGRSYMSYTISLFSVKTKQKEQQLAQPDFFEKDENLEKLTPEQQSELENRLLKYQYKPVGNNSDGKRFEHADFGEAFLTDSALYFSTSNDFDCIFEVGLTASEFTDTGEFAKYDGQAGGWEEI